MVELDKNDNAGVQLAYGTNLPALIGGVALITSRAVDAWRGK